MIIREATYPDIPAIARVHVDTWRTTYAGIVPDHYLADLSYERRASGWQQILDRASTTGNFTYVAETAMGEVIGFVNGGRERNHHPHYNGELYAIYILKDYQGQGMGRRFVQTVAQRLHQMGIDSMLVWVLAENPACQFYAALGGQPIEQKELEIGGKNLVEVAYGWASVATLRGI
jgi:ribosomal protein S18 acetylase RimI-like enzyme